MDSIISCGRRGVPLLVEAVSDPNPLKAGNAAFCLEQIGAADGKNAAKATLDRIQKQPRQWPSDDYAVPLLKSYLRSIDTVK
jgi:hypothetical protein